MAEKKSITLKEQRAKIIKDRAARLARDAKKQGMTPEALLKKKTDTYLGVVGGAASLALPFGAIARGATALFKGIGGAAKVSNVGKTVAKGAKKVSDTAKKLKTSKTPSKTTAAKPKADAKPTAKPKTETKTKLKDMGRPRRPTGRSRRKMKDNAPKKKTSSSIVPKIIGAGGAAGVLTAIIAKKKDGSAKASGMKGGPPQRKGKENTFGMGMVDDLSKSRVRRKDNMEGGTAPIADKKKKSQKSIPKKVQKIITAGGNVGFGPKGNMFPKDAEDRKRLMKKYGGTGSAAAKAAAQGKQGNMKGVGRA